MKIKAITFDFWDTLAIDDSDEAKRSALGLPTKAEARLEALRREVQTHHPEFVNGRIAEAFQLANETFRNVQHEESRTLTVAERLGVAYKGLGIPLTPGFSALVREIEEMEIATQPDFVPGVRETLPILAERYRLGIISDTIHTPGRLLRDLLAGRGLLNHFSHWVFSDEAGSAKPARKVFELAAAGLGAEIGEIVHVGDRERTDVAGAQQAGAKAILFTGAIDRGSAQTKAEAFCEMFSDLPGILERLV